MCVPLLPFRSFGVGRGLIDSGSGHMAAKAIVDALPFPLKDLSWERVPEVAAVTGFGFTSVCDLLKLVPSDIVRRLNCVCIFECIHIYFCIYICIWVSGSALAVCMRDLEIHSIIL